MTASTADIRCGDAREADIREGHVIDAFVDLADSLIDEYDQLEFLYRLLDHGLPLVGGDAGAVLLHHEGRLHLVAASNGQCEDAVVLELRAGSGPAYDAFRLGEVVRVPCLVDAADRWPTLVPVAVAAGWTSAIAFPLRLREDVVGAFVVFWSTTEPVTRAQEKLLRGFSDVGTIAILQQRAVADVGTVNHNLHLALESRLKIEQAKGMVAEATGMPMGDAFEVLRRHARSARRRLRDVAVDVIDRTLDVDSLVGSS